MENKLLQVKKYISVANPTAKEPYGISHVMIAIDKSKNGRVGFCLWSDGMFVENVFWDFTKTYDEQDESVILFLYDILF